MGHESFDQAARLVPRYGSVLLGLPGWLKEQAFDIHIKAGQPIALCGREGTYFLNGEGHPVPEAQGAPCVSREVLREMFLQLCGHSVFRHEEEIRQGFVCPGGNCRVGLCGTAVMEGGEIRSLRDLSSASVRIARQIPGAAAPVAAALWEGEQLQDTLILAPPGAGKTTLLRDLIRSLSQGEGHVPLRVGVADERGELAALYRGRPQMDLGEHTDVVEGCPKAVGMMLLLRGMTPQVLAVDEVTDGADVQAMRQAVGCGVVLLSTAHGTDRADLLRRPLYRAMLEEGIFRRLVTICRDGAERTFRVEKLEGAAP